MIQFWDSNDTFVEAQVDGVGRPDVVQLGARTYRRVDDSHAPGGCYYRQINVAIRPFSIVKTLREERSAF